MVDVDNLNIENLRFLMLDTPPDKDDKYIENQKQRHHFNEWYKLDLHVYVERDENNDFVMEQIKDLDLKLLELKKMGKKKICIVVGKGSGRLRKTVLEYVNYIDFVKVNDCSKITEIKITLL